MQLKAGTTLQNGKYRIIRVLGQGGFGITYLAEHTMLDKMVAIKEFFPKEYCDRGNTSHVTIGTQNSRELVAQLKNKFIKEARNISKLSHTNIVTIHDVFQENDTAYYVMEYVDGFSLSEIIKTSGALDESEAVGYIRKVCEAVGYMHSLSMNHLDLKPANIMVRKTDNEPVLIDFGLSKQYDASGDQTSTTPIGISHGFAPVEQYRPGGVATFTPQTDIYALGATLFNMLTGSVPPHYCDILLEDRLPTLPSSVSQKVAAAIEHAMEIKKNNRPSTIAEFLSEVGKSGGASSAPGVSPAKKTMPDVKRVNVNKGNPSAKMNAEETVMLNVPLASKDGLAWHNLNQQVGNSYVEDYIDLGLSVKWATKLSGIAIPLPFAQSEVYSFEMGTGVITSPAEFLADGHRLPSIRHFEELIERCSWTSFSHNGIVGYKITGPNGNVLMMPLGTLNHYLTAESLRPDRLYYYFLYLGEYIHTLAKGVPVRANVWTIVES